MSYIFPPSEIRLTNPVGDDAIREAVRAVVKEDPNLWEYREEGRILTKPLVCGAYSSKYGFGWAVESSGKAQFRQMGVHSELSIISFRWEKVPSGEYPALSERELIAIMRRVRNILQSKLARSRGLLQFLLVQERIKKIR